MRRQFISADFDWTRLRDRRGPRTVDPRRRMQLVGLFFTVLLAAVLVRALVLEATQGEAFRAEAAEPLRRSVPVEGVRGRLLARDGTVLAYDRRTAALAVHYRYLEDPPNPRWLRVQARRRLPSADRGDPDRLAAAELEFRAELDDLAARLAELAGISGAEWSARTAAIQARVERIAAEVNRRRRDHAVEEPPGDPEASPGSLPARIRAAIVETLRGAMDESPLGPVTIAEEVDYHVVVVDLPLAAVAEIETHPRRYGGARIVYGTRRTYPAGPTAAHVLGYLGAAGPEDLLSGEYRGDARIGRAGVERRYEPLLRGRPGVAVEVRDRSGRLVDAYRREEPGVGSDLVLTLVPPLQQTAERLLDDAAARRRLAEGTVPEPAGAAAVVLDAQSGAVLAAASAPRFDPNAFEGNRLAEVAAALADPARPLFDRTVQMALPPGSVFKTLAAVALLESAALDPAAIHECRGYLHRPDRMRCAVFTRFGHGHGPVDLFDALCESCNVYFFHHAAALSDGALRRWAERFGFGHPTGIDLAGEAAGTLPPGPLSEGSSGAALAELRLAAVGQGPVTASPLQVARMMAAIANGGRLVTPHVVTGVGLPERSDSTSDEDLLAVPPPAPIAALDEATLTAVREGLLRVVADPRGTAHGTVHLEGLAIAGKTGTAETGGDLADHAWFAGYAPAERPRYVVVVVIEHGGDGATAAGPVARRLFEQLRHMGLLR